MIKMIWKTLAVDKMDIEKTADLKCISRLLVEKWHVDQIKMTITVSPRTGRLLYEDEMIRRLPWGLLQKTQIRKMPSFPVVARTPFWSFCAGQRRIGPGQITDGT